MPGRKDRVVLAAPTGRRGARPADPSIPPHVLEGGTDMRIRSRVWALLVAPALLLAALWW